MSDIKFDFDDILIVPESMSDISSRKEVNIYDEYGMLPLFTAPMDTVVNRENQDKFNENKIYSILPRGNELSSKDFVSENKFQWLAYGLDEFEEQFIKEKKSLKVNTDRIYVLIDIANGNLGRLYDSVKSANKIYGSKLCLMIGNIANPDTFKEFAKLKVDYIRCGIGNGQGCLTTANIGIGYPMGSLVNECYEMKVENGFGTNIVADGGMRSYSDIIKALALGANQVMCGGIFNKALESASPTYFAIGSGTQLIWEEEQDRREIINDFQVSYGGMNFDLYKKFRGMSTKEVQKDLGKEILRTSEGIVKYNKVEYTLSQWCENFKDYLSSAMSYTNSKTLDEFRGSQFVRITQNSFNRFNK